MDVVREDATVSASLCLGSPTLGNASCHEDTQAAYGRVHAVRHLGLLPTINKEPSLSTNNHVSAPSWKWVLRRSSSFPMAAAPASVSTETS